MLNRLGSWAEVEATFAKGSEAATEAERIELLCDYYYDPDEHPELGPFSDEYAHLSRDTFVLRRDEHQR